MLDINQLSKILIFMPVEVYFIKLKIPILKIKHKIVRTITLSYYFKYRNVAIILSFWL